MFSRPSNRLHFLAMFLSKKGGPDWLIKSALLRSEYADIPGAASFWRSASFLVVTNESDESAKRSTDAYELTANKTNGEKLINIAFSSVTIYDLYES